jgi:PAS domain S-box-containing protein
VTGWIIVVILAACGLLAGLLIRTRRQLWASRESFNTLAQRAPVGILKADAEGRCTYANETWCEISGLTMTETLGHGWGQAVHPDDREAVAAKWEESVRHGKPYVNELRVVRPDGSVRYVLAGGRPTRDDRGGVSGFIGTVLDVTERRVAQQKAREKQSLLRTLVDHSSAAIYLKDTAGRYLLVNRRFMELWPAMKDFRDGTTPYEWFPEEAARSFIASDAEVWQSGETKTFEEVIAANDGPRTYLSVKFPVYDDDHQVVAVGGISADITELEQARRALAEREKLLRSLIDVQENEKQFLCHEFHDGLIQYAVGSKMLLESLREGGLPEGCEAAVDSVIDCLAKGIDDGRRVIRGIRPAALDDLGLRAALDDLASDLRESGIEVDSEVDPNVDGIPAPLQTTVYRVVQESLNNARKHSGSRRVRVVVCLALGHIELTTEDFGHGFVPAAVSDKGFGLIGIRERVRLAGGTCCVDSRTGQGTCVKVQLPLPT